MDDLDLGATITGFSRGQRLFGRYVLQRMLGRGGMGVVWLAQDVELGREVALKFLPEIVSLDPEALADLKRETNRNLGLTHPHIVRIHDFVSDGRTAAISMEFVTGPTLSALKLDQPDRVFRVEQLRPWMTQLVDALAYAHEKAKVVHRDLKPANLMLTEEGEIKVTDFGIAHTLADSVTRVSRQAGTSGSPPYMSPQQVDGLAPKVTDDIYSLGATLFELLTGKPPFHSGGAAAILHQIKSVPAPPVAVRRAELGIEATPVPASWETTIAACLAKDPAARPQSVREMSARLGLAARHLGGAPSGGTAGKVIEYPLRSVGGSGGDGPSNRAAPLPPTKAKLPLMAAIAAAVAVLGGLGWYFGILVPEQRQRAEAQRLEEDRIAHARGGLIIHTTPAGAEVRIGSVAQEIAPVTLKDLKLGTYPVKARLPGFDDWDGIVEVRENDFAQLDIPLVRSRGTLEIGANLAEAEFHLRGTGSDAVTHTGKLPVVLKDLPTGDYELTATVAGLAPVKLRPRVERGPLAQAAVTFDYGHLELITEPAGAEVLVDGKVVGRTPWTARLVPGELRAELRLKGFQVQPFIGQVTAGTKARQVVGLTELTFDDPHYVVESLLTLIDQLDNQGRFENYADLTGRLAASRDEKLGGRLGEVFLRTKEAAPAADQDVVFRTMLSLADVLPASLRTEAFELAEQSIQRTADVNKRGQFLFYTPRVLREDVQMGRRWVELQIANESERIRDDAPQRVYQLLNLALDYAAIDRESARRVLAAATMSAEQIVDPRERLTSFGYSADKVALIDTSTARQWIDSALNISIEAGRIKEDVLWHPDNCWFDPEHAAKLIGKLSEHLSAKGDESLIMSLAESAAYLGESALADSLRNRLKGDPVDFDIAGEWIERGRAANVISRIRLAVHRGETSEALRHLSSTSREALKKVGDPIKPGLVVDIEFGVRGLIESLAKEGRVSLARQFIRFLDSPSEGEEIIANQQLALAEAAVGIDDLQKAGALLTEIPTDSYARRSRLWLQIANRHLERGETGPAKAAALNIVAARDRNLQTGYALLAAKLGDAAGLRLSLASYQASLTSDAEIRPFEGLRIVEGFLRLNDREGLNSWLKRFPPMVAKLDGPQRNSWLVGLATVYANVGDIAEAERLLGQAKDARGAVDAWGTIGREILRKRGMQLFRQWYSVQTPEIKARALMRLLGD